MAEFVTVARVSDLPAVGGKEVFVKGTRLCIFRQQNGEISAVDALCPHKGVPLAVGCVENGAIICAMHGWEFDLKTGACRNVPGHEVRVYPVRLENGEVQIDFESPHP